MNVFTHRSYNTTPEESEASFGESDPQRLNAIAQRWTRSVKSEALSQLILFGERSLWYVLREYVAHDHQERPHQGKGNVTLFPADHGAFLFFDHVGPHNFKTTNLRLAGLEHCQNPCCFDSAT